MPTPQVEALQLTSATCRELHALAAAAAAQGGGREGGAADELKGVAAALVRELEQVCVLQRRHTRLRSGRHAAPTIPDPPSPPGILLWPVWRYPI